MLYDQFSVPSWKEKENNNVSVSLVYVIFIDLVFNYYLLRSGAIIIRFNVYSYFLFFNQPPYHWIYLQYSLIGSFIIVIYIDLRNVEKLTGYVLQIKRHNIIYNSFYLNMTEFIPQKRLLSHDDNKLLKRFV